MIEVRIHGRGGQGAVTAVTLLAKAAGVEDKFSQAFPAFGPERRGAPVKAFCRISDKKIHTREQVYNPDYVIVLDPSLLFLPEIVEGMKPSTVVIINSSKKEGFELDNEVHYFDATSLALDLLKRDIVNTAMLGVFSKVTSLVKLESVLKALEEVFPPKLLEPNKELVSKAFENTEVKNE
ncbi:MAG: 2-oxoacid:acceptor oxidoreductase family protein [Candidatus Aenigmarchaeota archaeon]